MVLCQYVVWSGSLSTVPLPTLLTVSVYSSRVKPAVTAMSPVTVTLAGFSLPVRSPLHPLKCQPVSAVAVSVTTFPY